MRWVVIGLVAAWFLFGNPANTTANLVWPNSPAPWEGVRAFYYPDRDDLTQSESATGLGSLMECRNAVYSMAAGNGDPDLARGDYECGVGCDRTRAGFDVCRVTAQ